MRLIPAVAVPAGVFAELAAAAFRPAVGAPSRFAERLAQAAGMRNAALFGSGRAALTTYLRSIARPGRDEVVVPAYTCWSVPAAVVRAGLRLRLVDVDPSTFDMDPQHVRDAVNPRTLAVLTAHLLAPCCDVAGIKAQVKTRDEQVLVIEDAAQASRPGPSPADAVILSFGRGKPLPLGGGGALLGGQEQGARAHDAAPGGWVAAAGLAMTALLTHPRWYRLPESIPWLGIGSTIFEPDFDLASRFHRWQARLGLRLLERLPALRGQRTQNARALAERIGDARGGVSWRLPVSARAEGPLRLPVLAPSRAARRALLSGLREQGVGASSMYPGTLADIPALAPCLANPNAELPGARELADKLLTLPVYPGLKPREIDAIGTAFERVVREAE